MNVQQISVFLENKAGRLSDVSAALKDDGINIRALTIAESANYGVLRMIVNNPDVAVSVLKTAGFVVKKNPVLAVEVDDREGILHDIMNLCGTAGLNIEYMYSFIEQVSGKAILFMRFEGTEAAEKVFADNGFRLLSAEEACLI
ncbi:MAG: ACT domain-containing protein [Chitinispirillales bacterium]|jgi:hypothetical protein|nr:ACT domain-containing protein [Chitinispirillales bacterium]